jgi:hypothetical protein
MRLAWLIYNAEYDTWEIKFEEPEYYSGRLIPIVYQEVQEGPPT